MLNRTLPEDESITCRGVCLQEGSAQHPPPTPAPQKIEKWAVRILLECFPVELIVVTHRNIKGKCICFFKFNQFLFCLKFLTQQSYYNKK